MFTEKELLKRVNMISWAPSDTKDEKIKNTVFILNEIQKLIFSKIDGSTYYPSNFIKQCGLEDWHYAAGIADRVNKELLDINFYQNFVKDVKNSSDYISTIRRIKLEALEI